MSRGSRSLFLLVTAAFLLGLAPRPAPAEHSIAATRSLPATRSLAVTLDDLPYVHVAALGGDYLSGGRRTTTAILDALEKHRVTAVGFVNEVQLQASGGQTPATQAVGEAQARTALLVQWVDAGMVLGNHTFSHRQLNGATVAEFQDEIVRGEAVTRRLMSARQPYRLYFRHPMTRTGDTLEKKEAIERFLHERGYTIAPHTIENMDFAFNVAYTAAKRRGDDAQLRRIADEYLRFTAACTAFAEAISPQVFGREIPQTLLLHANEINADLLATMLGQLADRGYRFVTLDEAMADPAYRTKDTQVSRSGPTWLWRWSRSLGQAVSFNAEPEAPEWIMAEYERLRR